MENSMFFPQKLWQLCRNFSKNILCKIGIAIILSPSGKIPPKNFLSSPNIFQLYPMLCGLKKKNWWNFPIFLSILYEFAIEIWFSQFFLFQEFAKFFSVISQLFSKLIFKNQTSQFFQFRNFESLANDTWGMLLNWEVLVWT